MLSGLLQGFLELLGPLTCLGCDEVLRHDPRAGRYFCAKCAPLVGDAPAHFRLPGDAMAAFRYEGPIAEAIKQLKFKGRSDLSVRLSELLLDLTLPLAGQIDAIVPIPLHPQRLRVRGYNQAALLARPIARSLGVPLCTQYVRRTRDTAPQTWTDEAKRHHNVAGAFSALPLTKPQRILLVDDVRTTGATLAEVAAALLAAGACSVSTLTLAVALS